MTGDVWQGDTGHRGRVKWGYWGVTNTGCYYYLRGYVLVVILVVGLSSEV